MMKIFAILLFFLAPTAAYSTRLMCTKKFPTLAKLLQSTAQLQQPKKGTSFAELVSLAKTTISQANAEREKIQNVGCGDSAANLDDCLKPLLWSCESLPFTVDMNFFATVKKSLLEEKAVQTGQLFQSASFVKLCCSDFGCKEDGVSLPTLFNDKKIVAELAMLASTVGPFGDIALSSLKLTAAGLHSAKCSCEPATASEITKVSLIFSEVSASFELTNSRKISVAKIYSQISKSLQNGLPQKICILPGN